MLHRSASSRRRRESRSAAPSAALGRRASLAVPAPAEERRGSHSERDSLAPEAPPDRSPRHDLAPDPDRASRRNLAPDFDRSPRHSLAPDFDRSPRHSLVPDFDRSPRHSLAPEIDRSTHHSLAPDIDRSPRHSLAPDFDRSPRHSLAPDFDRSPRHSLAPDFDRSPRHSLAPDFDRSPRHSLTPDFDRSPRHSLTPDPERSIRPSPRSSLVPDDARAPRRAPTPGDRSPRHSLAPEAPGSRLSPRPSLAGLAGAERPARGELTLTFQEPVARRASEDYGGARRPSFRGTANAGFCASEGGSRRASSSVSQVSVDEQRRLVAAAPGPAPLAPLATYGSVAYQLKDANMEASGTCDFLCRALRIVNRTVVVSVLLGCLAALPVVMLIMGVQFLRDCPREPHLPLYMVVGGALGTLTLAWLLHGQLLRPAGPRPAALALSLLLLAWFALGNYWTLHIRWPDFQPTLYEPNRWCHRTLYTFALAHLAIVYSLFALALLAAGALAACQLAGCRWLGPARLA